MKTYLDCIPCFFRQALEVSRMVKAPDRVQKDILDEVGKILPRISLKYPPPLIAKEVYAIVTKHIKSKDPFKAIKRRSNELALSVYDKLKQKVRRSRVRLLTAVELAIAGNIIDYGVKGCLDVEEELNRIISYEKKVIEKESKKVFDYPDFKRCLKKAKTVLYLGDNAGEVVFDRVLIEEIKRADSSKEIFYAVRGAPIINDVLEEDARSAGIEEAASVINNGCAVPGTPLGLCSEYFLKVYRKADMVISKGQGNFETLSRARRGIFFLFKVKCPVVAEDIGCKLGDTVLFYSLNRQH